MAKTTVKIYTPEESRKKYGNSSLIIVGGAATRPPSKPSPTPEEIEELEQGRAERERFIKRLEKDIKEQFGWPPEPKSEKSDCEKEENQ